MDQTIHDIENALPRIIALLNALVAGGVVKSQSGIVIAALLNDLSAVVQGAAKPNADTVTQVEHLLKDLSANGIIQGQFIDEAAQAAGKFQAVVHNVQSNQTVVIKSAELFGVKGIYAFIPDESDQGKSLGLSAA